MIAAGAPERFVEGVVLPWIASRPELAPRAGALAARLAAAADRRADSVRRHGVAIPSTLVVSLTSTCNMRCPSCVVLDTVGLREHALSCDTLEAAMTECDRLGIANFVLVGGEPLLWRHGVERLAADHPGAFFSVFTNGRPLAGARAEAFAPLPNVAFFFNAGSSNRAGRATAIEPGVLRAMEAAERHGLLHGFAATVTADNVDLLGDPAALDVLARRGARYGIFLAYLPAIGADPGPFAAPPAARARLAETAHAWARRRGLFVRLIPEDEALFGGCMAAGRHILHLSAYGTLDPCPFVPVSNARFGEVSILDALRSPFLSDLRAGARAWEARGEPCAYRGGAAGFRSIALRHGARPNRA